MARILICSLAIVLVGIIQSPINCKMQVSIGIQHDMSKPTYGLQQPTSSQIQYDDKTGLSLKGTIGELLGPPIKIANGFGNIIHGGNMAGIGNSLKSGGALLGLDAKVLEAAGGAHLLKGGLLMGGAAAKHAAAGAIAGPTGQKISSIIEVPVKVVAVKDLASGKVLHGLGQMKQAEAQAIDTKGQTLVRDGNALKSQGLNQIIQGTQEGVQNIGNLVSKTSENVNSAIKYLPLIMEMQSMQQQHTDTTKGGQYAQQEEHRPQQSHLKSTPHQMGGGSGSSGLTGGSLFGGLGSLMPGFSSNDPLGLIALTGGNGANIGTYQSGSNRNPFGSLFGASGPNPTYAAVMNSTNPLTNLLMNPGMNPFLLPIAGGPLSQSLAFKQPIGTHESSSASSSSSHNGQGTSFSYNLFPGVKVSETVSSSQLPTTLATKIGGNHHSQQQQQQQQQITGNKS